jgi:septum formation protein
LTESTQVKYKNLTDKEINYYVDSVNPIDKAGSYGIQDWIGMIGVENINGSYTSVLGLPIPQVTNQILKIINENL